MRDVTEFRALKEQPGRTLYIIGGATLVSGLMNEGLIDELRLIVHPIILGGGKTPFAGARNRRKLDLVQSNAGRRGRVVLSYRI